MYMSGDPITMSLELCFITKRETSKAQQYFVVRFVISKICSLYFLLGVRQYLHSKPHLNTKHEDLTIFDYDLSCFIIDRTKEILKRHWLNKRYKLGIS